MNLPEKLAREIARVAVIRERYARAEDDLVKAMKQSDTKFQAAINMQPALALMAHALEHAYGAIGGDNALDQITALENLQGFKE